MAIEEGPINYYKQWLVNINSSYIAGNAIYLSKDEDNPDIITVGLQWELREEEHPSDVIVDRQTLIDLISQWEEAVAQNPEEIIIERFDDNSMTVTAFK